MEIRKLADSQVNSFDTEYIGPGLRPIWDRHRQERFHPEEAFTLLDIGGGNGVFVDSVLGDYPNAKAVVLDNSRLLLDRNRTDPRKKLVLGSAIEVDRLFPETKFDLICLHWLLHHLVVDGYGETTCAVKRVLESCRTHLKPQGRISIFENMYDGWLFDRLPGRLIFYLTSSRTLAPITARFGANTAGIGVCFRSQKEWAELFQSCRFDTVCYADGNLWNVTRFRRLVLHMGPVRCGHFWLGKTDNTE